jgi:predicted secreted protein
MPGDGGQGGLNAAALPNLLKVLARKITRRPQPVPAIDGRGRRLVAVIECMLNQNARDAGAASFPAMNWALVDLCREYDVGIVQMPCPEIACLGFDRARPPGTSIRQALDTQAGRQCCANLGVEVVDRLATYADAGCQLLAILGGNPQSPGCAVHDRGDALLPESGVLMRELQTELRKRGMEIPFRSLRDADAELLKQDLDGLREVFVAAGQDIQQEQKGLGSIFSPQV